MLGIQIKLVEKWTYLLRLCKIKREKKTVSHQKKTGVSRETPAVL